MADGFNIKTWETGETIDADELNELVQSESIGDAGITSVDYVTELDETVTETVESATYPSYMATLSNVGDDYLFRGHMYRITFDAKEYVLPCLEWFVKGTINGVFESSVFPIVGNLELFCDASGFYTQNENVPFLLTSVMSTPAEIKNEGLFLFTQTGGEHTIKIERIEYTFTQIPNTLLCGSETLPIYRYKDPNIAYASYDIGANDIKNKRNSFAIGNCNTINDDGYMAIGSSNTVTANNAICVGIRNLASGVGASAYGVQSNATGTYAQAFGVATTSSGMFAESHGYRTTANHKSQFTFGEYNTPDASTANANSRGNYVEIVGNGTSVNSTSNARTLDWDGNESLAGGITLGKGTEDEVSLSASQLKRLIALLG